jgi:hypothetical protein
MQGALDSGRSRPVRSWAHRFTSSPPELPSPPANRRPTMSETFVQMPNIRVLRVLADWSAGGPAEAMAKLESKLPSIRGRKFYGLFRPTPTGEEYFACVARVDSDDPVGWELDTGEIPEGWYARRKIKDWANDIGQLAVQFTEMVRELGDNVDHGRPQIEFYRSQSEMFVLVPILSTGTPPRTHP